MGDLFGDAFAEDRSHRFFGRDIFDQNTQLSFSDLGDIAVSKSSNISFLKVDDLDPDLRNILVVGDSFVCYSVTAKRTSIRAIDTTTGEKSLLKGHESFILDLKLSVSDNHTFCSVDHGSDPNKPHIFVWKRSGSQSIEFQMTFQSKLRAKMVQSYPIGDSWGISDGHNIAVLTKDHVKATNYNQLPYHISLEDETVSAFSFSPNGDAVAAIVANERGNQYLQVWRLLEGGRVAKVYDHFHNQLRLSHVVSLSFLADYIVTVSRDEQSFGGRDVVKTIPYVLKLWSTSDLASQSSPAAPPRNLQTLLLHVPEYQFRGNLSTSLANPTLECDLRVEPKKGRCLMLSSRKSNIVACLALSPAGSNALPIHHVTYLDFKAPVVSMDIMTILSRDHHSSEEGEHLKVSAYQEEAADQSSIQQYYMLAHSLFDYSKYGAPDGSATPSPAVSGNNSPHPQHTTGSSTILNMLSRVPSTHSNISTVAAPGESLVRTLSKSQQPQQQETFTPTSMTVDKATLDALQSRSSVSAPSGTGSTPTTPHHATTGDATPSSTPAAPATDLPDFLRTTTPKAGASILSAFQRSTAASSTAGVNGLSAILSAEKDKAASTAATTPIVPPAAAAPAAATSNVGKKLLSSLTTTPAKVESTPSTVTTPAPTPAPAAVSVAPAPAPVATSTLLSALGKAAPVATAPPAVSSTTAAVAPVTPSSSSSSSSSSYVANTASTPGNHDLKHELLREMHHLHTATITEMRTLLHQQHQVAQRNFQDLMGQMKNDISTQMTETLTTKVQQQLSNKLKESMRDTIRDTIRAYLQDAFRNAFESSLLPAFQSGIDRMFEQVNNSVDDGMEGVLTVLQEQQQEALEARAQVVAQVSETAATLMKNHTTATATAANDVSSVGVTPEMIGSVMKAVINVETMWKRTEQTVGQLQEMMGQMQVMMAANNIALMNAGVVGSGGVGVGGTQVAGHVGATTILVNKPTPAELLAQGKIAEAIIAALDNKNVDETVAVLAQVTPAMVNSKCSPLVRLCITQQLASDLSVNSPSEGLAKRLVWIKSLVVTIVRIPKPELESNVNLKRNFPTMIQAVLESIQAAKEWIARAQYDNGEDDAVDIPVSVHTDLQLLELVMESVSV